MTLSLYLCFTYSVTVPNAYHLVDGINPELVKFMKMMSVLLGQIQQWFNLWQKSSKKDIECAFGIFQIKFNLIKFPLQGLDLLSICNSVMVCIILHNMIVEKRVKYDERENASFYEI